MISHQSDSQKRFEAELGEVSREKLQDILTTHVGLKKQEFTTKHWRPLIEEACTQGCYYSRVKMLDPLTPNYEAALSSGYVVERMLEIEPEKQAACEVICQDFTQFLDQAIDHYRASGHVRRVEGPTADRGRWS